MDLLSLVVEPHYTFKSAINAQSALQLKLIIPICERLMKWKCTTLINPRLKSCICTREGLRKRGWESSTVRHNDDPAYTRSAPNSVSTRGQTITP